MDHQGWHGQWKRKPDSVEPTDIFKPVYSADKQTPSGPWEGRGASNNKVSMLNDVDIDRHTNNNKPKPNVSTLSPPWKGLCLNWSKRQFVCRHAFSRTLYSYADCNWGSFPKSWVCPLIWDGILESDPTYLGWNPRVPSHLLGMDSLESHPTYLGWTP